MDVARFARQDIINLLFVARTLQEIERGSSTSRRDAMLSAALFLLIRTGVSPTPSILSASHSMSVTYQ